MAVFKKLFEERKIYVTVLDLSNIEIDIDEETVRDASIAVVSRRYMILDWWSRHSWTKENEE